jgi:tripartite-type tricarboxylate transporter receptor subunit TctC
LCARPGLWQGVGKTNTEETSMNIPRRALLAAPLLAMPLAMPLAASAQDFPTRPIRIVVPFPPGGTTDLLARLFGARMSETMGQPVLVENRAGAGGSIGADVVAKAAPDGHTLLFHNITFPVTTATLAATGRAPHLIERDFAPVSLGADVPMVILAHPGLGVRDLQGFLVAARARAAAGNPMFYGSTGPGSTMNMVGEVIKREGHFSMEHVPFRGAAPMVQELLAGRVQLGGDQLSTALGHVRGGGLAALAVLSAKRSAALPDVPTVRESGMAALEFEGWNGFFAPAGTPPAVLARLNQAVAEAANHPPLRARIIELGAEPGGNSAADFGAMVHAQAARMREVVAQVDLRAE